LAKSRAMRQKTSPPRLVLAGAIAVVSFWVADALLASTVGDASGGLWHALVSPNPETLGLRLLVTAAVLGGSFYVERLVARRMQTEAELRRATYKLGLVYDHSPDPIMVVRSDFVVDYVNAAAEQLTGTSANELVGRTCHEGLFGRSMICDECPMEEVLRTGAAVVAANERCYRPGQQTCIEMTAYPVLDDGGSIESVVQIVKDVTQVRAAEQELRQYGEHLEERVRERTQELERTNQALQSEIEERGAAEYALRESEARFQSLVDLSPDLIMVHADGLILFMNHVGARLLGYRDPEDVVGRPVMEIVHPESTSTAGYGLRATTVHDWGAPRLTELRLECADGSPIDVVTAATPLMFHGRPAIQAVAQDISARKRAEETVRRMAYYDTLTGLPNRALFDDRLTVAIRAAERDESAFAVLFMDINDFKDVNDTRGHAVGDEILTEFANRLRRAVRKSDTVARIGGDEFTVLLPKVGTRPAAEHVVEKMLRELTVPVITADGSIPLNVSVGAAFYPQDGESYGTLMHSADMAMYSAKYAGERYRFADSGEAVYESPAPARAGITEPGASRLL